MIAPDDTRITADACRLAFALLARCLRAPLDIDELAALASAATAAPSMPGADSGVVAALADIDDCSDLAPHLAREHARLFRGLREGHGPQPPFESLWREGVCMGENTRRVIAAYNHAGFPIGANGHACDDLATELLFMASLCAAEAEAEGRGDDTAISLRRSQQRVFLDRHLLRWAPHYCRTVAETGAHPFYRAALEAVASLLDEAAVRLAEPRGNGLFQVEPQPSEAVV
jgi:TorA maturation chaperone TorD